MHIKNPQSAQLSNHEVLLHLRKEEAEYTGTDGTKRNRAPPSGLNHMLRDGLAYLQTADYAVNSLTDTHPTRPMTLYKGPHSLFRALAPKYRLNKAEYLQLYNLRPTTQVMLELVIEEAGTRFKESDLDDILHLCKQVFDEEEVEIPDGVEDMRMEKIPNKLLGARKAKRRVGRKKA
ncbi:HRDC-like protein [Ampelomyces quisqualis]|uniref:DNA-directed RNA polymerase III subunit RPC9 n=1 Tax=Ampelomyces quisqualis TaxID=50730 RepID=A0A6A5QS66_AMPQU|nr:HRDC-like protein [Ampelomyces quisqualis]